MCSRLNYHAGSSATRLSKRKSPDRKACLRDMGVCTNKRPRHMTPVPPTVYKPPSPASLLPSLHLPPPSQIFLNSLLSNTQIARACFYLFWPLQKFPRCNTMFSLCLWSQMTFSWRNVLGLFFFFLGICGRRLSSSLQKYNMGKLCLFLSLCASSKGKHQMRMFCVSGLFKRYNHRDLCPLLAIYVGLKNRSLYIKCSGALFFSPNMRLAFFPSNTRLFFFSLQIHGSLSSKHQNEQRVDACLALSLCASSKQIIESLMFCVSGLSEDTWWRLDVLSLWPLQNSHSTSYMSVFLASSKGPWWKLDVLSFWPLQKRVSRVRCSRFSVLPTIYKPRRLRSSFFLYPYKYLKHLWIFYFQNRV